MRYLLHSILIFLFAVSAFADEPRATWEDFTSKAAKESVKAYESRLQFLQRSLESHQQTAKEKLRDSLQQVLREQAEVGDLDEVRRLTELLQKLKLAKDNGKASSKDKQRYREATVNLASLKKELDNYKEVLSHLPAKTSSIVESITDKTYILNRPLSGNKLRYRFNSDGTVDIAGKRSAARWAPIDDRKIFIIGEGVSTWVFSPDWRSVNERWIGNTETKHVNRSARLAQ